MLNKKANSIVEKLVKLPLLAQAIAWPALGAVAFAGGYGAARLTSPRSIAENADKEIEQEALATEIDVTTRRIAALEKLRERQQKRTNIPSVYDRFV